MNSTSLHQAGRKGFTLIELLTVIAIIGILAGIIIPVVGSVRQGARESANKSNLRQIGMSANLYAGENKGFYPAAYSSVTGKVWYQLMSTYMYGGKEVAVFSNTRGSNIITYSPTADFPVENPSSIVSHYSMHPLLGLDSASQAPTSTLRQLKRNLVVRPTEVILFADGTQEATGTRNARAMVNRPNDWQFNSNVALSAFIPAAASADGLDPEYSLRYRNRDNVHTVMVDGSVRAFKRGTVTYGNIIATR